MIEIRHRNTSAVLYTHTGSSLSHANLSHANLSHADLSHADLSHADLSHADLSHADLAGANLTGAYLARADLAGADLARANLTGANLSWLSHDLLAEILLRAADSVGRRMVAGLVLVSRNWCWKEFASLRTHPEWDWAVGVLRQHVTDNTPADVRAVLNLKGGE